MSERNRARCCRLVQCLGVLLLTALLSAASGALAQSGGLQDLVRQRTAKNRRADVIQPPSETVSVGAVIRAATFSLTINDDLWKRDAYAYRGMAVLDERYLDFAYGGDDYVVYAFEVPQVRNGGQATVSVVGAADHGDLVLRVSTDGENWTAIGQVDTEGHAGLHLPPVEADRLYLMLDGREGDGIVIGGLVVFFSPDGALPRPTPTPPPDAGADAGPTEPPQGVLGYVPPRRGNAGLSEEERKRDFSRGERADISDEKSGITRAPRINERP